MSGESIKRKTQGEDHRNKSVSYVHRHKPGPLQLAHPFSSSLTRSLQPPAPSHPPSLQIPPLPLLGTRNWRVWDARYLACCYTPISLSSQAECTNPQDADGNIWQKKLLSALVCLTCNRNHCSSYCWQISDDIFFSLFTFFTLVNNQSPSVCFFFF